MLGMLGAMGILLAGVALPALFDRDDRGDDEDDRAGAAGSGDGNGEGVGRSDSALTAAALGEDHEDLPPEDAGPGDAPDPAGGADGASAGPRPGEDGAAAGLSPDGDGHGGQGGVAAPAEAGGETGDGAGHEALPTDGGTTPSGEMATGGETAPEGDAGPEPEPVVDAGLLAPEGGDDEAGAAGAAGRESGGDGGADLARGTGDGAEPDAAPEPELAEEPKPTVIAAPEPAVAEAPERDLSAGTEDGADAAAEDSSGADGDVDPGAAGPDAGGSRGSHEGGAHDRASGNDDARDAAPVRDIVTGTEGDDALRLGPLDFATGGAGADVFTVETDGAIGVQAEIADFDPQEDKLMIVWDDTTGDPPPDLTLGTIQDAADMAQILLDGVVVAHVTGASNLRVEDIDLVPQSRA